MKRLILLCFVALSLVSCSVSEDDNTIRFHPESLPIESVDMPIEFQEGHTYEITVSYYRPASCYEFNDFYYQIDGNERIVAVINTVYENIPCDPLDAELVEASFNFRVTIDSGGTYVFKYWQGNDASGNDVYYILEVPVVE